MKLVDKLVEECSENINEYEMIYNKTLNDYEKISSSCTVYIVFFCYIFYIKYKHQQCFYIFFYLFFIYVSLFI